jgi:class 3 adenylate cyclase
MRKVQAPETSAAGAAALHPHDDLAPDILRQLEDTGEYRVSFLPTDPQRLVDLRWSALAAGRLMGRPVHVAVTRADMDSSTPITVRVTADPVRATDFPQQRDPEF